MKQEEKSQVKARAEAGPGGNGLTVVSRPIVDLTVDPMNARVHPPQQVRQIAHSIEAFGFNVPVLIDAQDQIIAGHGRLLAAQKLGLREVPTICLAHLTEPQRRAFQIADNRLTEHATWDKNLLGVQLKALAEVNLEFSLEVTGFATAEIDLIIEGLTPATDEADNLADIVPAPSSGAPVSRVGDLWLLGPHRLYCGNALEAEAYQVLLEETKAGMVFTDPPYNVPIAGHASGLGRMTHRDFSMASGEMTEAEFTTFLTHAFTHLADHTIDGALIFACMDWRHLEELLAAGRATFTELKNLCIWDKGTGGMGSLYRSQHEMVFVYKSGTASHQNNIQLGQFGRYRTNVWRYPGVNSFARAKDEGNLLTHHPTVKPVALVADAILDASKRGDVILDAFLGSGTTLIAAEQTGRICYAMELEPAYVDTAVRRWQTWTGQRARHATSGQLFDTRGAEKGGCDVG
ncbi:MAG: site-specific DNA-methyltransferase [Nitrospira sp. BO4]|jgi:DNA modification methylase|nr:site-specific DNA-methyltransferase [Nitrospira sp. BO4]